MGWQGRGVLGRHTCTCQNTGAASRAGGCWECNGATACAVYLGARLNCECALKFRDMQHRRALQVRVWVRASLYRAYRMLAMLKDLPQKGGPPSSSLFAKPQPGEQRPFSNPEVPQGLAKIIESVAAGEAGAG